MNILKEFFYKKPPSSYDGIVEYLTLQESLISSYDVKLLVKKLSNYFINRLTLHDLNPIFEWKSYTIFITIKNLDKADQKFLDKILSLFGYFISKKILIDNIHTQFTIEPKHAITINKILESNGVKCLYHITHKKHLKNIQTIGLAPRGTETTYHHPDDRIYLLIVNNINYLKGFRITLAKNKNCLPEDLIIIKTPFDKKYDYYLDDLTTMPEKNIYACFILKNVSPDKLELTNI